MTDLNVLNRIPWSVSSRMAKSERNRQSFVRHAFRDFMERNELLSDSQTLIATGKAYVEGGGSFKALDAVKELLAEFHQSRNPKSEAQNPKQIRNPNLK